MRNRLGSYKKILISPSLLRVNKYYLQENLKALMSMSLLKEDLATLYILLFLRIKHPKNWLQKFQTPPLSIVPAAPLLAMIPESFALNAWEREKLKGVSGPQLFSSFHLKGIPQSINHTMIHWYQGLWKIETLFHIPNSRELLRQQAKNTRCITLIIDPTKIDQLVLGARDPLSFVLHDLMHANQFFDQKDSLLGQLGFYQLAQEMYDRPELNALLKADKNFKKEFEYVVSDMNAYVIHLFKCLKSSIYRTIEGEKFFAQLLLWWNMNEAQKVAAIKINTPLFGPEDEIILKAFFESKQEIFL